MTTDGVPVAREGRWKYYDIEVALAGIVRAHPDRTYSGAPEISRWGHRPPKRADLMWPAGLTDARCLRIICAGLIGTCWTPLGGAAVTWIMIDCLVGYAQTPRTLS